MLPPEPYFQDEWSTIYYYSMDARTIKRPNFSEQRGAVCHHFGVGANASNTRPHRSPFGRWQFFRSSQLANQFGLAALESQKWEQYDGCRCRLFIGRNPTVKCFPLRVSVSLSHRSAKQAHQHRGHNITDLTQSNELGISRAATNSVGAYREKPVGIHGSGEVGKLKFVHTIYRAL